MLSFAEPPEINNPAIIPSLSNFVMSDVFSGEVDSLSQMKIFFH
jgi:hypothetical protein